MSTKRCITGVLAMVTVFLTLALSELAFAEDDYTVGSGDVLHISVWQHVDLDRDVTVSSSGKISFPPIGEIEVGGMTPAAIGKAMSEQLAIYTGTKTIITASVVQFKSREITVLGEVVQPGTYSFEAIPSLLGVINKAGGPIPSASLDGVKVIRPSEAGGEVDIVNMKALIDENRLSELPSLKSGDTIVVPNVLEVAEAQGEDSLVVGISIIGAVVQPGIYSVLSEVRLNQAIMLAGGPTPDAKLNQINVVRNGSGVYAIEADLRDYLQNGTLTNNPVVRKGDSIFVGRKSQSIGSAFKNASTILQITTAAISVYLMYRAVRSDSNTAGGIASQFLR